MEFHGIVVALWAVHLSFPCTCTRPLWFWGLQILPLALTRNQSRALAWLEPLAQAGPPRGKEQEILPQAPQTFKGPHEVHIWFLPL